MSEDKIYFGYYLVAFIDLLGQREEMRKFRGLPQNASGPEYEEFIKILKSTIGKISDLQKSCKDYFESFVGTPAGIDIPDTLKDTFNELGKTTIHFQHFSDGLVIFVPLRKEGKTSPLKSVYGVITACASMMLMSLVKKSPIRGGLTVGLGAELNKGEIYGPVVGAAYELESQIAQYPRIVVGNELCSYLESFSQEIEEKSELVKSYNIEIANACKELLANDFDGYPIIDYMGAYMTAIINDANSEYLIKLAREFIRDSLVTFQKKQNSKLAFRYSMLHSYFESNLGNVLKDVHPDNSL